ncbi:hypothetical protein ACFXPQ_27925 [Streptomyces lydicus]
MGGQEDVITDIALALALDLAAARTPA